MLDQSEKGGEEKELKGSRITGTMSRDSYVDGDQKGLLLLKEALLESSKGRYVRRVRKGKRVREGLSCKSLSKVRCGAPHRHSEARSSLIRGEKGQIRKGDGRL